MSELKTQIAETLAGFATMPLREAASALFSTLGYASNRTLAVKRFIVDRTGKQGHCTANNTHQAYGLWSCSNRWVTFFGGKHEF